MYKVVVCENGIWEPAIYPGVKVLYINETELELIKINRAQNTVQIKPYPRMSTTCLYRPGMGRAGSGLGEAYTSLLPHRSVYTVSSLHRHSENEPSLHCFPPGTKHCWPHIFSFDQPLSHWTVLSSALPPLSLSP